MTSCFHMARLPRAITLLSLLAGCGSSPSNSADLGTNTPRDSDLPSVCPGAGTPTRYRITTLHIPTSDDVTAGNVAFALVPYVDSATTRNAYTDPFVNPVIVVDVL